MIEMRYLIPSSTGKPVLQYRQKFDPTIYAASAGMFSVNGKTEWSDWRDVPTVTEVPKTESPKLIYTWYCFKNSTKLLDSPPIVTETDVMPEKFRGLPKGMVCRTVHEKYTNGKEIFIVSSLF